MTKELADEFAAMLPENGRSPEAHCRDIGAWAYRYAPEIEAALGSRSGGQPVGTNAHLAAAPDGDGCRHNPEGWPCALVEGRDKFIVSKGLWDEFVAQERK